MGQKIPLKLPQIWAIRVRLQIACNRRDLALFNLAIDSKLRACDLLKLRVSDVSNGGRIGSRAMIMQQKTGRPVQFEITPKTREAISIWISTPVAVKKSPLPKPVMLFIFYSILYWIVQSVCNV